MSDWPVTSDLSQTTGVISTAAPSCQTWGAIYGPAANFVSAAAWPAANRALYIPFTVSRTVTAYKMAFEVAAQAGNCDVGIYDYLGNRLVSAGSTTVGPAGLQVIDITDTVLTPGVYYMAMNCDTTTTLTIPRANPLAAILQMCGMQQQAVGAVTLPTTATFANPASNYVPSLAIALKATI